MPSRQDIFQPTRGRVLAAVALAAIGFLLPQEVPLEWYPLNHPGDDINYLAITCASDKPGTVHIYYDATRGFNELESIRWPVTATKQTLTYTFPLPDAPISALRLDPVGDGATLTVRQMRIVNRRGELIRRFSPEMFRPLDQVAVLSPAGEDWTITATPGGTNPSALVHLPAPLVPVGMDGRNLQRCLLSTGYLALMLWILLLALLFIFDRPKRWGELASRFAFTAGIALLFALVGNRGLIRNSVRYAHCHPPALASARLNPALPGRVTTADFPLQLFFDSDRATCHTGPVILLATAARISSAPARFSVPA